MLVLYLMQVVYPKVWNASAMFISDYNRYLVDVNADNLRNRLISTEW